MQYLLCFGEVIKRVSNCGLKAFTLSYWRPKVDVLTLDCHANISTSSTFHPARHQPPVAVSLRGNNNKRLLQYHYYHFGCLPETLRITLHGRQIADWNGSVMEANCLSAGLVCISCKSHVHSSETWLTNRTSNSHSEARRRLKMTL